MAMTLRAGFARAARAWRKRRAIQGYVRRLPHLLRKDYGYARSYTPAQIRASIARGGLDADYSCYALAMYAEPAAFDSFHAALGETCDYAAMRAEVAAIHFHGDTTFTVDQAYDASPSGSAQLDGAGAAGHGHFHGDHGHSDGGH